MLTRLAELTDDALARALTEAWDITPTMLRYRAVGFGSHHWDATGEDGASWFVTVDEVAAGDGRLRAALGTAIDLHDAGCAFVVAPLPLADGTPFVRTGDFAIALYHCIEGEHYAYGEFDSAEHRRGVLDLLVELHAVSAPDMPRAVVDDFGIRGRGELELALEGRVDERAGPYANRMARLLAENARRIEDALAEYDRLVGVVNGVAPGRVVTHGEPHAGNTIRTPSGWVLVDWDTALVAPPERDLWSLDAGDGAILRAYADATGTAPLPAVLALYRIRWDLSDIAVYIQRFRRPHDGDADDEKSWAELCAEVARLSTADGRLDT